MWTFENPPLDHFEREYGFTPSQKWLDSLRLGSLRISGEDGVGHRPLAGAGEPLGSE